MPVPDTDNKEVPMSEKFCVSISNCRQDAEKAILGFGVALTAIANDKETMVWLSADGVWAAKKGEAEQIEVVKAFPPLKELINNFVDSGGQIIVCPPCMKGRAISEDELIDGARVAGGAGLVEFLSDGTPCISY